MHIKIFTLILLLIAFPTKSYSDELSIEKFTKEYVLANRNEDRNALGKLFYDVWEKCKFPKHNTSMKSHFIDAISSFDRDVDNGYSYELLPIIKRPEQDKEDLEMFFGVSDVEYYPLTPSHSLGLSTKSGSLSSTTYFPVRRIKGKWYFLHACAGKGMDEYLIKVNEYQDDSANIFDDQLLEFFEDPSGSLSEDDLGDTPKTYMNKAYNKFKNECTHCVRTDALFARPF